MDSYNLKTASSYINNLLLARGLLRNGKPIEFAHPSKGEGGKEATMAQIINLVHDLTLKRDRDQEQREGLAQTIRTLRLENAQQTQKIEKLETRTQDLTRQLSLAQSQERSARAALRTAESSARVLREEMARLKTTVQQVRTSCVNDIRKRDVQIQRLKTHLTAQQRGNKTGLVGASITITPGSTGMGGIHGHFGTGGGDDSPSVDDPGYSLKQETTEFLTQLSQSLSDENDNLIGLVRNTVATLRELQGMPDHANQVLENGALDDIDPEGPEADMLHALPTSYDTLAADMDRVLENLRTLLTNPNFVPIEEVEVREQQIMKLRSGWEVIEARWKDAVLLMEGWRQRLLNGGDTVNLEELKMGLGLGIGMPTVNGDTDLSTLSEVDEEEEALEEELEADEVETEDVHDSVSEAELPEEEPVVAVAPVSTTKTDLFNIKLTHKGQQPLHETNGNVRSPRKVMFVSPAPSVTSGSIRAPLEADENTSEVDLISTGAPDGTLSKPPKLSQVKLGESKIPRQPLPSSKRQSSPRRHPEERSPKLSVQEKLKLAQAEAEAARLADGLNKASAAGTKDTANGEAAKTVRKARIGGRPKRRKSTLTPAELEGLMFAE